MKIKKIKDSLTDESEKIDFRDPQHKITERSGEVHLLMIAIDPAIPMEIKNVTYSFTNRKEGLQAFNILAATARNIHKTYVEDDRLHQTARTTIHYL